MINRLFVLFMRETLVFRLLASRFCGGAMRCSMFNISLLSRRWLGLANQEPQGG
jgi:hypothetical protein